MLRMRINKLKKELACTKVKLRNTSKEKKILDVNNSRCSFASRFLGMSEGKNHSPSLDRSQNERTQRNFGKLEKEIETLKVHVNVLQNANDKVVKENALLRLRRKFLEPYFNS